MRKVIKFQEGGQMAPVEEPVQQQAQDPVLQIAEMMAQGLQNSDCQMCMEACAAFLQLLQQAQAPQEPIGQPAEGAPVFKKGGKIVKRKKCCGKKC